MKTKPYRKYVVLFTLLVALWGVGVFSAASTGFVQSDTLTASSAMTASIEIDQLGPDVKFVGDLITYTLLLTNTSNSTLSDIIITDTWATKMEQDIQKMWQYGVLALYQGYTASPPDAIAEEWHQVNEVNLRGEATWRLNSLAPGDGVQINFIVRVPITLQPSLKSYETLNGKALIIGPSSIENTVIAIVQEQQHEAPLVTTQVLAPLLRFTKSAYGETVGTNASRVGRVVTYTLIVENLSPEERSDSIPAAHLVITETFPEDVQEHIISSTTGVPGVSIVTDTAGTLVWTFPADFELDAGTSTTLTTWVRVPPDTVYKLDGGRKLVTNRLDVLGHAEGMPFRDAALQATYGVKIWGPIDKELTTGSLPTHAKQTFPNRVITYTLTFYNPLYDTDVTMLTIGESLPTLPDTHQILTFVDMVAGGLGEPVSPTTGSLIIWQNVSVPANGIVHGTFHVHVSSQLPFKSGCGNRQLKNTVTATLASLHYEGPNAKAESTVIVVPQLRPSKSVVPDAQFLSDILTFTIGVVNNGDTTISPPLLITDELPLAFAFVEMLPAGSPGTPTLITETASARIYQWDNVLTQSLLPDQSINFSYLVTGEQVGKFTNIIYGYNFDTFVCPIKRDARIKPDFDIRYSKYVVPDIVVQGDLITYTVEMFNNSARSVYTITEFADRLKNSKETKGTRNAINGGEWYTHTLPAPFRMDPNDQVWAHTFPARMTGYEIGHQWCESLAIPATSRKSQHKEDIQAYFMPLDGWGANIGDGIAPVCVLPKFSLYQQVYPNPIAVGQEFSVVLTLRDNRLNPTAPLTDVILEWHVPLADMIKDQPIDAFQILDSAPAPTLLGEGFYAWHNVTVPSEGAVIFTLHVRAPLFEQVGWSKSYDKHFIAQVVSDHGPSICIPSAKKFVVKDTLPTDCTGAMKALIMNQGIELDKVALLKPKEVPPYGLVDFKLIVKNLTGAPLASVLVTDTLPSLGALEWQYVKMVNGPEPISTQPLVWQVDSIPASGKVELDFTVRAHQFLGLAYNQVTGTAPIHLGLHKKILDHVQVEVISGIGFFKVAEPDNIMAGHPTSYTITLLNYSEDTLTALVITDTLPQGFTYTHMIDPRITPQIVEQQLVWHIADQIKKNQTYKLIFGVETDAALFSGFYHSNLSAAAINADTGVPVWLPASEDVAPVYVQGKPQIVAEKYVQPTSILADDEVTYTLTLFNETDAPYPVIITDTLPPDFTFIASTGSTPVPTVKPGAREQLIWNALNTLQSGETITLTFRAQADYFAVTGAYCNAVQVQMGGFLLPRRTPMLSCVSLTQLPQVDVQISVDDGELLIQEGQILSYTLIYTNSTDSEAVIDTLIITDTLQPMEYLTVTTGPDWQFDGTHYVYHSGPLNPGESRSITITAVAADIIPDDVMVIENRATIAYTAAHKTVAINSADNQSTDHDFLQAPDLVITALRIEPTEPGRNVPLTVTVTISNQGAAPVTRRWDGSQGDSLFAVELYFKPHPSVPPKNVFDHEYGWDKGAAYLVWLDDSLAAGDSIQALFHITTSVLGGEHDIYAQVDIGRQCTDCADYWGQPWGLILEPYEGNNISAAYFVDIPTHVNVYLPLILRE